MISSLSGPSTEKGHRSIPYIILLLFLGFLCSVITGAWSSEEAQNYQRDSEAYVIGRIYEIEHPISGSRRVRYNNLMPEGVYEETDNFTNRSGFLFWYRDVETTYNLYTGATSEVPSIVNVYTSQSALHGTVQGIIALLFKYLGSSPTARLSALYLFNTTLLFALFINLCFWVKDLIGPLPAVFLLLVFTQSEIVLISARNLYWVPWTFLLPFTVCLFIAKLAARRGNISRWLYFAAAISVMLRCMCGFEFVTVVLVTAELPFLYYFFADSENRKKWFFLSLKIAIAMVAGFIAAILIWAAQSIWMTGDPAEGLMVLITVIAKRTGAIWGSDVSAHIGSPNAMYDSSLAVSRFSVLAEYFGLDVRLLGSITVGRLLLLLICSLLLAWGFAYLCKRFFHYKISFTTLQGNLPFLGISLLSFIGPAAWYFLVSGHSHIHHGVCELVLFFPSVPFLIGEITFLFSYFCHSLQSYLSDRRSLM